MFGLKSTESGNFIRRGNPFDKLQFQSAMQNRAVQYFHLKLREIGTFEIVRKFKKKSPSIDR